MINIFRITCVTQMYKITLTFSLIYHIKNYIYNMIKYLSALGRLKMSE